MAFRRFGIGSEDPITSKSSEKLGYSVTAEASEVPPNYDSKDPEHGAAVTESGMHENMHRKLKPRHVQLIGIGGTIGKIRALHGQCVN